MQTLTQALIELVIAGAVEQETAAAAAPNRHDFLIALERARRSTPWPRASRTRWRARTTRSCVPSARPTGWAGSRAAVNVELAALAFARASRSGASSTWSPRAFPCGARSSRPARRACAARRRSPGTTTSRSSRTLSSAAAAGTAARRSRGATRPSRPSPPSSLRAAALKFGLSREFAVAAAFCAVLVDRLRDRPRAPRHPEPDRPAGRRRAACGADVHRPVARVDRCGARCVARSSSSPRSPIRAGWAWATSSSPSCSEPCSGAPCRSRCWRACSPRSCRRSSCSSGTATRRGRWRSRSGRSSRSAAFVALFAGHPILDWYLGVL